MPNLYVIAGANDTGKTTISKSLLPNYFNCNEFVNADKLRKKLRQETVVVLQSQRVR